MKVIRDKWFLKHKKNTCEGSRGSVTIEAAIALPLFICVIVSIAFIIKVVYTHEIMQHAITEAAEELSSTSYLYYMSGLNETHDEIRDGLKSRGEIFQNNASSIADSIRSFGNVSDVGTIIGSTGDMLDTIEGIALDPVDEMKNIICYISSAAFEDVKTQLCIPLVKLYMNKYLTAGTDSTVDERLEKLNIVDGMEGIDFSKSRFFENDKNDIDIIVSYRIEIPVPIKILPSFNIVQRANVKAWLGGDLSSFNQREQNDGFDIWSLSNFERGRKLRDIFGANLPFSFPVIARFDNNTAVMIKSMDLTAKSYQDEDYVTAKIEEYIDILHNYKGQEVPWGKDEIVIKNQDINIRELILIIPQNPIDPKVRAAVDESVERAALKGISLRIEEYGMKITD